MSDRRWRIEPRLFVAILLIYIVGAAISTKITTEVLAIRFGMAAATSLLLGVAYRLRTGRDTRRSGKGRSREWQLLMWVILAVVVIAFVVGRLV